MKSLRAAASYAKALFALAKERNVTDRIGADLDGLVAALDSAPDAMALLSRPWLGAATRRAAALEVGTRSGVSPLARDFLALVAARGRIAELSAIAAAYRDLVDADAGRARVRVRTVVRLTDDERRILARRLASELGVREVVLEEVIDPHLLGGFVAEAGSLVLDASLNGQLARLKARLTSA